MERTMDRFKKATSLPPFIIETKSNRRKRRTTAVKTKMSFAKSIGSGEFRTRLFGTSVTSLTEPCNATSILLAKGTLCESNKMPQDKENKTSSREKVCDVASADTSSFDLVLDDTEYDYDEEENSILEYHQSSVAEKSNDDESEISSIGTNGQFDRPVSSSRLLLVASFPQGYANSSVNTTPSKQPRSSRATRLTKKASNTCKTSTDNNAFGGKLAAARSLTTLGHTYLQQRDYAQARSVLLQAYQIYESIYDRNHTSVAQALDIYGVACLRSAQWKVGLQALQRSFQIRNHHLGIWHVDTVDTYNKIAGVHWQMGHSNQALAEYQEVLKLRQAIMGPQHPSVAITAHALAKIYTQLSRKEEAQVHFALAKQIYEQMGMRYDHEAMAKLLRDHNAVSDSSAAWLPATMTTEK